MHYNTTKIFLLLLTLLLFYTYGGNIFNLVSRHLDTDIMLTYLSGKMLNAHAFGYHFSKEYLIAHNPKVNLISNLSPPFSVMIVAFIARYMSYQFFFTIFIVSTFFVNIFALIKLYQHFYPNREKPYHLILISFILANLFYWPSFENSTLGQVAFALNSLVIFSYLSLEKEKFIRTGFFLALAINIKIFFGIFFVYFFATKNYKAFFSFLLFTLLFAFIPLIIYGKSIYQGYFEALNRVAWYGVNWNASWYGCFVRIFGETSHRFHSIFFLPKLGKALYYCVFAIYVTLIFYFCKKNKNPSLIFAFTLSSMLLISPLGWSYYFPILVTALLINLSAIESNKNYTTFICLLFFALFLSALPLPLYFHTKNTAMIHPFKNNLFFIALLLFNALNFMQLLKTSERVTPLLTFKFKLIILSICILPSVIGISNFAFLLNTDKLYIKDSKKLAFANDLLPSNHQ